MQGNALKATQGNGPPVVVIWLRNLDPYSRSDKKNGSSKDAIGEVGWVGYTLLDRR